ncbi:ATP-binding protein [Paenibacillus sp. LHD-117]|uniref:ATP-binding protein n=1 Tax=Paenibacillus sp. LHD-117 TaxID=3071412 RepID=UPI0027E0DDEE|nr:ATP-binding protein [Paenibacillus sp. LHD-117]MDQ6423045.1 ATP-binding protein [Paenibacillus sp. LHD-117]
MSNEPNDSVDRSFQLFNRMEELHRLNTALEELGAEFSWTRRSVLDLSLACEEVVVNIVNYGYPEGCDGLIEVEFRASREAVEIRLSDRGTPFNPLREADPLELLEMDIEDRPIGGLGIFFVKRLMDETDYKFENGMNRLRLMKKFRIDE